MKFISLLLNSLIFLGFYVKVLNAQTKTEYANWLYKQGDYFRAISVYRELQFFSKDVDSINFYQFQIGKAYYRSGKHYNSIAEFVSLLERPISDEMKSTCLNMIALNYLNLSLPNQALYYATKAFEIDSIKASFTIGLIYANLYDWEKARGYFNKANASSSYGQISKVASENLATLNMLTNIKQKSPFVALFLSAIIPGAGQFYSGHYVDALQAFVFVGSFAYMSYIAYKYDNSKGKGYCNFWLSISITSLFYIANLIGAERTATYYNLKQKQSLVRKINEKSLMVFE